MSFTYSPSLIASLSPWVLILICAGCTIESPPQTLQTVVPTLITLLQDPNPDVRRTAALSLGKIAESNSITALVRSLQNDTDAQVREYSAWAIGQSGTRLSDDAALALVMALGDEIPHVKQAAAASLEHAEPRKKVLRLLREAMAISEVETRIAVVQALSEFDTPSAYPLFIQALDDSDSRVRQAAVAGLGELGDPRAVRIFRKILLNDGNEGVRTEAAFRLGKLGNKADVYSLQKAIESDPTPNVHLWASWALREIEPAPVN